MFVKMLSQASQLLSSHDVTSYCSFVREMPRLSLEQEREAFASYRLNGNRQAHDTIVCATLWLGVAAANRFRFMGDHQADIIQEANLAICKAISSFDPDAGARFSTYAATHVKGLVHNYMIDNWRVVKVATTKARRKAFHNLYRHSSAGEPLSRKRLEGIATDLGVGVADVLAIQGHMQFDARFGMPINENGQCIEDEMDCDRYAPERLLVEERALKDDLRDASAAMQALNSRELDIITDRMLAEQPVIREVLAQRHGVSNERIRQIENLALKKMRVVLAAA